MKPQLALALGLGLSRRTLILAGLPVFWAGLGALGVGLLASEWPEPMGRAYLRWGGLVGAAGGLAAARRQESLLVRCPPWSRTLLEAGLVSGSTLLGLLAMTLGTRNGVGSLLLVELTRLLPLAWLGLVCRLPGLPFLLGVGWLLPATLAVGPSQPAQASGGAPPLVWWAASLALGALLLAAPTTRRAPG